MSDLRIIKEIEKELGDNHEISYNIDNNNNVIGIDLSDLEITSLPPSIYKLQNLKDINLNGLDIENNSFEELFRKLKKINRIDFYESWTYYVLPDIILNYDIEINPTGTSTHGLCFDTSLYYPPADFLLLGFEHTKYYNVDEAHEMKEILELPENKNRQEKILKLKKRIADRLIKSENRYSNPSNILPFSIKQFKFKSPDSYFGDIHIADIPVDTRWIFLTGENGYGKTLLLQGLVIGMFGNKDRNQLLGNNIFWDAYHFGGVIELKSGNKNIINIYDTDIFEKHEYFAAFGASRLNKNSKPVNSGKTFNLFNSYGELLDIEDRMIMWERAEEQKQYYDATRQILVRLMKPYITDIHIERNGSKTDVIYFEADSIPKPFLNLASGFRSIITMVGDMIIRLSEEQPNINNFEDLAGIVIIDEFDLHLHPKMQRELVERLTDTFQNIQFIVSTHSPIPFLGAPKNSVFIKVDRDKEKRIFAEKLDVDVTKLTPNTILTSPVFGFEDINSKEMDIDAVETSDKYSNVEAEKRMKEKLQILKHNDNDFFNSLKVK